MCRAVASFEKTSPRLSNSATPAAILPENVVKVFVRLLWLCPDEACFWLRWDQPTSLPALNEWSAFHICGPASATAGGWWLKERHPPFRIFISSQDLLIGTRKIIVSQQKKNAPLPEAEWRGKRSLVPRPPSAQPRNRDWSPRWG